MNPSARGSVGFAVLLAGAGLLFGCGGNSGTISNSGQQFIPPPMLALSNFVTGLTAPVGFEAPNDGTNRIFIIEQPGTIRITQGGSLLATPFLDITSKVESGGGKGLLGLEFHPSFSAKGRFYVAYTQRSGTGQLQSVIAECQVPPSRSNRAA